MSLLILKFATTGITLIPIDAVEKLNDSNRFLLYVESLVEEVVHVEKMLRPSLRVFE
jgi:hypothetical protein